MTDIPVLVPTGVDLEAQAEAEVLVTPFMVLQLVFRHDLDCAASQNAVVVEFAVVQHHRAIPVDQRGKKFFVAIISMIFFSIRFSRFYECIDEELRKMHYAFCAIRGKSKYLFREPSTNFIPEK